MCDLTNVFNIYANTDKVHYPRLLGRVLLTPTDILVLADYENHLQSLNGPVTPQSLKRLDQWKHGSHSFGVSLQDLKEGKHPELLTEHPVATVGEPPAPKEDWYKVHRDDLDNPMFIKFKEGKAYLDGHETPLTSGELDRIIGLAMEGKATVHRHKPEEHMAGILKTLVKSESSTEGSPSDLLTQDPLIPSLGNRKTFQDTVATLGKGTFVMLHLNEAADLSQTHGHKERDAATKAAGNALAEVIKEQSGKGWHLDGDNFMVQVSSIAKAAGMLRSLRAKLEAIPPIGGTHKLTMKSGMGPNPQSAKSVLFTEKTN